MTRADLASALAAGPVLLDGGLATELEAAGHDLSGTLWSGRLLLDFPEAVTAAHARFFAAGDRAAEEEGDAGQRAPAAGPRRGAFVGGAVR